MTPKPDTAAKGSGGKQDRSDQRLPSAWYKKGFLSVVLVVLVLPVLLVLFSPLFAGGFVLWSQIALYSEEDNWSSFSVFEMATHTVDLRLADRLYWPALSSCKGAQSSLESVPQAKHLTTEERNAAVRKLCPELGRWQYWLLYPGSWTGPHKVLVAVLRVIPVSSLMFLAFLMVSYWLKFLGKTH